MKELKQIKALLNREQATHAKELFDQIKAQENVEYFLLKGAIEQKFQHHGEAINAYNKVLELDPNNAEAQNNLHLIQNILNFWNPDMFNP